ncbi:hypothetical protein Esi_0066_0051 [Ectocarpus siliculosus]|uniref:Uncharacterized protein n=1 Tax=Ectocarpus siliculosus TaxID=2880 RepID=D8LRF4_ECTSI|nr:hypothetical protein Esi_0066_0051 [Ectocarpus siliculosus]|eukprot:CBN75055.1 hypothetical protein Esi_0066_0051 [Ectocarpus siliculosus]
MLGQVSTDQRRQLATELDATGDLNDVFGLFASMNAGPPADERSAFRTTEENAQITTDRDLAASLFGPSSVHDPQFPAPPAAAGGHTREEDLAHARGDVLGTTEELKSAPAAARASDHDAASGRGFAVRRHSGEPVLPEGGQRGFDEDHHAGPAALSGSAGRRAFAVRNSWGTRGHGRSDGVSSFTGGGGSREPPLARHVAPAGCFAGGRHPAKYTSVGAGRRAVGGGGTAHAEGVG